jgi:hypothetical protein
MRQKMQFGCVKPRGRAEHQAWKGYRMVGNHGAMEWLHQEGTSELGGDVTDGDRGDNRESYERHYPDLLAASSLAAVLSDVLVRQGSRLSIGR